MLVGRARMVQFQALDEFLVNGEPRDLVSDLWRELSKIAPTDWISKAKQRDLYLAMQGITFTLSGIERPLPVDLVPRIIDVAEWKLLESGIKQRIRALELFLDDVYGQQQLFADRVVPKSLIVTSEHFHRSAHGIKPANGVRIHVSGIDIVRDPVDPDRVRCTELLTGEIPVVNEEICLGWACPTNAIDIAKSIV